MKIAHAGVAAALLTTALSACIPTEPGVKEANAKGGDFYLLDCSQLNVAAGSVRQRIAFLSPDVALAFAIVTPQGLRLEERLAFLDSALVDINKVRTAKGCQSEAPILAASTVLNQPVADQAAFLGGGRFLQAATFEVEANRDSALAAFAAKGVPTVVREVTINGRHYWRVLLGPITTPEEIARADAAAKELGLEDAFFVAN